MRKFQGFPSGKTHLVPIPSAFFTDVLPLVEDGNTLKVMLHIFRGLDHQDGTVRYLRVKTLLQDKSLIASITAGGAEIEPVVATALKTAEEIGFILRTPGGNGEGTDLIFLNSPKGRDALAAIRAGKWQPEDGEGLIPPPSEEWPGIFKLYEENIGVITPMIADLLQDAEKNFPPDVIQFAFEEAVKKNARNWKYIEAILRNWQEKGHSNGQDSRNPEKDRRKYYEGEYAEFINHE